MISSGFTNYQPIVFLEVGERIVSFLLQEFDFARLHSIYIPNKWHSSTYFQTYYALPLRFSALQTSCQNIVVYRRDPVWDIFFHTGATPVYDLISGAPV